MVVTDDDGVAERVRSLRAHGTDKDKYLHVRIGTNSRLDELQAAILRVRLAGLDAEIERRRTVARRYDARLERHQAWLRRPARDEGHTYYAYVVSCEARDALRAHLGAAGIEAPVHFPIPIHQQPAFVATYGPPRGSFEGSERLCRSVLSLPCHPGLREDEVDRVCAAVDAFAAGRA
jgi:dTDP-4-amino-4,6-dideoxygalactose transaminase